MLISVITVCYNAQATIARTVESFLAQDYPQREMVVIDGASSDRTVAIVESYASPLIRVHSERDKGIYDAMNKGLTLYRGEAFGFLNSDDRFHDARALGRIAEGLARADIVSGTLHFVRAHDGSTPVRIWRPQAHRPGAFARGYSLPHPTTYARRRVHETVGGFDASLRSAGDYDWLLRALEIEGFTHRTLDAVIADMQVGGESTAGLRALLQNSRELIAVRRRRLGSGPVDLALVMNLAAKLGQVVGARLRPRSGGG
jgi:glycosyltransferase involved in cell wall biosynthesis